MFPLRYSMNSNNILCAGLCKTFRSILWTLVKKAGTAHSFKFHTGYLQKIETRITSLFLRDNWVI